MLKPNLEPVLLEGVTASSSSPSLIDHPEPPLSAPLTLSFDYTRSVGPTLSKFFTALRERHILGVRGSDGRIHVPPAEYDPITYEPLGEMVPVSAVGTVVSGRDRADWDRIAGLFVNTVVLRSTDRKSVV